MEIRQIMKAEIGNKYLKLPKTRRKSGNRHPGTPPTGGENILKKCENSYLDSVTYNFTGLLKRFGLQRV